MGKIGGGSNGQVAEKTTGKGSKTIQWYGSCGKVSGIRINNRANKEEEGK